MAAGPSFRVFGIPVRIDLSFLVIAVLLGLTPDNLSFVAIWVVVVTTSVLLHELGHAVAFRAFGKQPQIVLQAMGGLTSAPGALSPGRDLVVSLAGPLSALVLVGLPALWLDSRLGPSSSDWDLALRVVVYVNIFWSLVNLLPVLPLDGGRVTAAGLHLVLGRRADRAAHLISVAVAGAAALLAYASGQIFAAFFAGFFAAYNLSQLAHSRARGRTDDLLGGYQALAEGDLEEARRVARDSSSHLLSGCTELSAGETARGLDPRSEGAARALDHLVAGYTNEAPGPWNPVAAELIAGAGGVDPLTERLAGGGPRGNRALAQLQTDLHHAGRHDASVRVGERAFALCPSPKVAYNLACSLALAGRTGEGLMWLGRAIEHGFGDHEQLDHDPDLEALRSAEGFEAVRSRLPVAGDA